MAQSEELISRQELLQVISAHTEKLGDGAPLQVAVLAWVKQLVEAMPAQEVVDLIANLEAVELTRCKDCERWKAEEGQTFGKCENWSVAELPGLLRAVTHMTGPDEFCSDAQRRIYSGIDIRG